MLIVYLSRLEIGIITPYNYQVKLIQQKLTQHNLHQHKIEIGTGRILEEWSSMVVLLVSVDAFQGRQKDVILLSCVRATQTTDSSTTTTGIGFVANRQRLNVSLTRAKYAMYILGHMASLNVRIFTFKLITTFAISSLWIDQWGLAKTHYKRRWTKNNPWTNISKSIRWSNQTTTRRTNTSDGNGLTPKVFS